MVTYSAAPLENETVAQIAPQTLKEIFQTDSLFPGRVLSALGFGRSLDAKYREVTESDTANEFYRGVIEDAVAFREGVGLYIVDDITTTLVGESLIAKISVTDDSVIKQDTHLLGGVAAFAIPTNSHNHAVLVTSGGLDKPAFKNVAGVSVLPVDYAFQNVAETLYTIANLVLGDFPEEHGTNWSEGTNVAITFYRVSGEEIKREYQLVLRTEDGIVVAKEANANEDGYISIKAWSDVEPGEHALSSFVYHAHEKFADRLNEIENKGNALATINADENVEAYDDYNNDRYLPLYLDDLQVVASQDVFGYDEHPVHELAALEEEPVDDGNSDVPDFGSDADTDEVTSEAVADAPAESDSATDDATADAIESEDTGSVITSPEDIETADDLVHFAEYEVTHSEEPVVAGDVNDVTAETEDPFALGAEYLINEIPESDEVQPLVEGEIDGTVFDKTEVVTDDADIQPEPLEELADPAAFENLQWSEVVAGDGFDETIVEDATPQLAPEFGDLSWEDVATTVADDDNDAQDEKPLKGFLNKG
jgi:hypothetical protein